MVLKKGNMRFIRISILLLGLYFLLVFLVLKADAGLIPFGTILIIGTFFITTVVGIVFLFTEYRNKAIDYFLVSLISILSLFSGNYIVKVGNDKTKQMADIIIEKIYDYKIEKGFYPNSLEELIPNYLDEYPETSYFLSKNRFRYEILDASSNEKKGTFGHEFILEYYAPLGVEVSYKSITGQWQYED